jgi:hypothetical protein
LYHFRYDKKPQFAKLISVWKSADQMTTFSRTPTLQMLIERLGEGVAAGTVAARGLVSCSTMPAKRLRMRQKRRPSMSPDIEGLASLSP